MKSRSRLLPAYLDGDRATLDFYIYTLLFNFNRTEIGKKIISKFQSKLKINTRFKGQKLSFPETTSFQNIIHPTTDSHEFIINEWIIEYVNFNI